MESTIDEAAARAKSHTRTRPRFTAVSAAAAAAAVSPTATVSLATVAATRIPPFASDGPADAEDEIPVAVQAPSTQHLPAIRVPVAALARQVGRCFCHRPLPITWRFAYVYSPAADRWDTHAVIDMPIAINAGQLALDLL